MKVNAILRILEGLKSKIQIKEQGYDYEPRRLWIEKEKETV